LQIPDILRMIPTGGGVRVHTSHHLGLTLIISADRRLVVANRLSEDADKTVLVLEAGAANLDDPYICLCPP